MFNDDQVIIEKKPLKPHRAYALCQDCLDNDKEVCYMEFQNIVYTTYPEMYPHKCPRCNISVNLSMTYPCIVYDDEVGD